VKHRYGSGLLQAAARLLSLDCRGDGAIQPGASLLFEAQGRAAAAVRTLDPAAGRSVAEIKRLLRRPVPTRRCGQASREPRPGSPPRK
jgi:hypothetical protein